ncbi:MAG: hypothetical protein EAZ57_07835 [Cytophagales bacterium]|nr:MAG: hypothetical protein EAZ67_08915 [Cytophagales bacterium]TAF60246.1 MAG: hypothetical protein EAZ57_07835 [Cytophagales bacterium]
MHEIWRVFESEKRANIRVFVFNPKCFSTKSLANADIKTICQITLPLQTSCAEHPRTLRERY